MWLNLFVLAVIFLKDFESVMKRHVQWKTPRAAQMPWLASGGKTRGKDTYLLMPPVRNPTLTGETNGAAN